MEPVTEDLATFEALFAAWEKPLFNTVMRWVWDEAEASDLVQEAFLRLWQRRDQLQAEGLKAYLFRTALNLAANARRRQKFRTLMKTAVRMTMDKPVPTPNEVLVRGQTDRMVQKALHSLPEKYRRVLVLCRFTQLTHSEIGDLLSIPSGTVASRLHKAKRLMREKINRLNGASNRDNKPTCNADSRG